MKIQLVKIQNFLTIGNIQCNLSDKGLVLIQGENKDDTSQDSNGAGKSSFPDAVSWALFGTTARGETGDAVVNRNAKKDCLVNVDITDDGFVYRIIRHRKHSAEKNRLVVQKLDECTGEITDLTKGTDKLTQEVVDKIIGCSADVFNAAIYAGQEKMPDLPAMTDKQLKSLVEEAAGIDKLQAAEAEARTRLKDAKSEFSLITISLENKRREMERLLIEQEAIKKDIESFDLAAKEEWKELTATIKTTKEEYAFLKKKVEEEAPMLEKVGKALAEIYEKLDGAEAEKATLKEHNAKVSQVERELAEYKSMVANTIKQIEKDNLAIAKVDERVGQPCGECGKAYEASDIKDAKAIAEERLKHSKAQGKTLSVKTKELAQKLSETREARDEFEKSMTSYTDEIKRMEELRAEQNIYHTSEGELLAKSKELKGFKTTVEAFIAKKNPHVATLERNTVAIETAEKDLVVIKEKEEAAELDIRVKEQVLKVFGPAGVRAYILDTVTPFLNTRTSHYLSTLTDGNINAIWTTLSATRKGEMREKFVIDVTSKVGAASFKGLSGGEKRKVRLACSMALQDLVSSRASKPIELYIADEIDHALDESGLERLMTILDEKAKDKGTALVISHSDLSDWIRQQVTIVKEGGSSKLEGAAL